MSRVWRLVWKQGGLTFRSDWTIHYDVVREFKASLSRDAPAVDAEMQSAEVASVESVENLDFPDEENGNLTPSDSPATVGGVRDE
jgi:hypothetical protein